MRSVYFSEPRYPYCSAIVPIKKYFDIDTGKFVRDRLEKIESHSLGEILDDSIHNSESYNYPKKPSYYGNQEDQEDQENHENIEIQQTIYNFPKFIPKDDDFDDGLTKNTEHTEHTSSANVCPAPISTNWHERKTTGFAVCHVKLNSWIVKGAK